ncbi:hypothetical protein GLOTRDRAFT_132032 [Gloeophyllum trabeum ATCC 11539]|uniref:Aminoglycoside phosphotransferase domain-containing protein n=1 Tax=Gloeophyllum trabeum (strain ATCC 11539 / FP-39264 / Madison 617) TaxID=670483 RepID=S7PZS9_GLOTA|nr:uncharacterized protein GLOTRDRAFT_132032 [Gloeophyllum trabeum ATCC 11539]EPQ52797.1 hypothetical protein GLOTRDRAFT_132032 [Gloeophyllum trabeum ATCC 11539]
MSEGPDIIARVATSGALAPILHSEVATIEYIRSHTSIPVPHVLACGFEANNNLGPYILTQKIAGTPLEPIFTLLTPFQRNEIITQVARWMLDVFSIRFPQIGSLVQQDDGEITLGPVTRPVFYVDGRAHLSLHRGPFPTARAYFLACAQRELDCSRVMFAQDTSADYQRGVEDVRLQVERTAGLMFELVSRCRGLDEDDPDLAPFSLDLHRLSLKNIHVNPEEPSKIVCLSGWQSITTAPLWSCARLPLWLRPSLSGGGEKERTELCNIFKRAVTQIAGRDSLFLRPLDLDDTRHTLVDLSEYDAVRDGFLILPTLESILATLPGQEDVDGLSALLDPSTLVGRMARINLVTRGSNAMFLAMPPTPVEAKAPPGSGGPTTPRVEIAT